MIFQIDKEVEAVQLSSNDSQDLKGYFLNEVLKVVPNVDAENELVLLLKRVRVRMLFDGQIDLVARSLTKQLNAEVFIHSHEIVKSVERELFSDQFKTHGMLAIHLRLCGEKCVVMFGLDAAHDIPPYVLKQALTPILCVPTQQDITTINYLVAQVLIDITPNTGQRTYITGANIYTPRANNVESSDVSSEQYMAALNKALLSEEALAVSFSLLINGNAYCVLAILSKECVYRIASYGRFITPSKKVLGLLGSVSTSWSLRVGFSKSSLFCISSLSCGQKLKFNVRNDNLGDENLKGENLPRGELARIKSNADDFCKTSTTNYKIKVTSIKASGDIEVYILEQCIGSNQLTNMKIEKSSIKGGRMEQDIYCESREVKVDSGLDSYKKQVHDYAVGKFSNTEDLYGAYSTAIYKGDGFLSHRQVQLLSDLYVPLDVELTNISISADRLIDLSEGDILKCSFKPSEPVKLCVAGEIIATAKFVKDEDELALEILQVGGENKGTVETSNKFSPNNGI